MGFKKSLRNVKDKPMPIKLGQKPRQEGKKKKKAAYGVIRKGEIGEEAQYITKETAIKKVQMTEKQFQRLCILKGVHPRQPKRRFGPTNATWYHLKDIQFLNHDPLIESFRQIRAFDKKMAKFIGRDEKCRAESYKAWHQPYYSLARLVKERYPTFEAAVEDALDDCLTALAIFSQLPVNDITKVKREFITKAGDLMDEFHYLVSDQRMITNSFISMKGFYFELEMDGLPVRWLLPHNTTIDVSGAVDFEPMQHFVEFYLTLLKYVNYRLYTRAGYSYPPKIDHRAKKAGYRLLSVTPEQSVVVPKEVEEEKKVEEKKGEEEDVEQSVVLGDGDVEENVDADTEDEVKKLRDAQIKEKEQERKSVFENVKVFINREVPLQPFALLIRAGGGEVGWQEPLLNTFTCSPFKVDSTVVTHHIIDRPALPKEAKSSAYRSRSFVQPQWVFDSFNNGTLSNVGHYAVGAPLPPHASPFVAPHKTPEEKEADKVQEQIKEEDEETILRKTMMTSKNRWLYRAMGEGEMMEEMKKVRPKNKLENI